MAGLLLAIPDLVALDLPALAAAAGYPGTKAIPATSYLLALLALKLTATRRVSHVDDLLTDPAPRAVRGPVDPAEEDPRSPTTPTGCPTTTSARSWPPWTRK